MFLAGVVWNALWFKERFIMKDQKIVYILAGVEMKEPMSEYEVEMDLLIKEVAKLASQLSNEKVILDYRPTVYVSDLEILVVCTDFLDLT